MPAPRAGVNQKSAKPAKRNCKGATESDHNIATFERLINLSGCVTKRASTAKQTGAKLITILNKIKGLSLSFRQREDGAATIEAVLWLPFFLALFGVLADVSMVFFNQTRLLRIVQDANRNMSIGRFVLPSETQNFVVSEGKIISPRVTATTTVSSTGLIHTTATVPARDLDLFGIASVFGGMTLVINAEHLQEQ